MCRPPPVGVCSDPEPHKSSDSARRRRPARRLSFLCCPLPGQLAPLRPAQLLITLARKNISLIGAFCLSAIVGVGVDGRKRRAAGGRAATFLRGQPMKLGAGGRRGLQREFVCGHLLCVCERWPASSRRSPFRLSRPRLKRRVVIISKFPACRNFSYHPASPAKPQMTYRACQVEAPQGELAAVNRRRARLHALRRPSVMELAGRRHGQWRCGDGGSAKSRNHTSR
jgi:hypothetical protein